MSGSSQNDFTGADMFRRLRDIIKRGVVKEVQMKPPRVRVTFGGEHQSGWLQWFTLATSERVDWSAPKVGDPVTVISEGGDLRNGVVFPGLLVDGRAVPSNKPNEHVTAYCDGATLTYDSKSHELTWKGVQGGTVRIIAESKVDILGKDEVTVTSENVVNIHGGKLINADADVINATARDSVNISATNTINLAAFKINAIAPGGILLDGPVHCAKTLVVDGLGTFRTDLSVEGDKGGSGNIRTAGSVIAGKEVQDRQGTLSEIRVTYNGHIHKCPDGPTDGPSILMS